MRVVRQSGGLSVRAVAGTYVVMLGFDLPDLDWDLVWPVLVIGLGLAIVYRAMSHRVGSDQP